ncbi:MAG: UvrD-helicase domain-containing protein, partial [Candidatus Liptonbacteria bacterium]|nr:UvrD-helicase domain-containing protein [Candidatus Liptonbacteria bacterium]
MESALKNSSRPEDSATLKIFACYEKKLEENNAFDFDDLIEKPVSLFRKHPELLKKYQKKFDAILVDEYQDVSPMQYELIKFLAGGHKNISVVGDDEQLIYGWRYANLRIFLDFEKDWPGARIVFLEENYRSTKNIIGAASAVAQNNQYRRPKNLWTKNPAGAQIKIIETGGEDEEAEYIATQISNFPSLTEESRSGQFSISGEIPSRTTAILYRTNAQSRALEQALIRHQIPYKIFGGLKFYERKEIKDVVAALRYF